MFRRLLFYEKRAIVTKLCPSEIRDRLGHIIAHSSLWLPTPSYSLHKGMFAGWANDSGFRIAKILWFTGRPIPVVFGKIIPSADREQTTILLRFVSMMGAVIWAGVALLIMLLFARQQHLVILAVALLMVVQYFRQTVFFSEEVNETHERLLNIVTG